MLANLMGENLLLVQVRDEIDGLPKKLMIMEMESLFL
jgi:hypothetical protein